VRRDADIKGEIMRQLHEETLVLVKEERRLMGLIIENLQKISDTKLFLEMGYQSLFRYCTEALGYSEASAYRRIEAVKVMRAVPEVKEKLNSGALNLTTVAIAQTFFKTNQATVEEKKVAIQKIEGCSKREAEKTLAQLFAVAPPEKKEKIHFHREEATLQIVLPQEVLEKLDRIKSLRSHKNPNMSYAEVIADICEIVLKKIDPAEKTIASEKTSSISAPNVTAAGKNRHSKKLNSRYISTKLKSAIWQRDRGQCTFIDTKTGQRCSSKHLLQIDHETPLFFGGETARQNLRLLCHSHHRLRDREFNAF
jgi:5-methylcytosine-specific restriction endonuclease McrA